MTRRALLAVCLAAAVGLPSARAQTEKVPFGQGTHAFRRILFDLKLEPVASVKDLAEPERTVVIVLGETGVVDGLPGRLPGFLNQGGAVLIATDRPWQSPVQGLDVTITGEPVEVLAPTDRNAFQGLSVCPFVRPDGGRAALPFFRLPTERLRLQHVATNRPSYIRNRGLSLLGGMSVLATLPDNCSYGGQGNLSKQPFAVGGKAGQGRLLILADHSVFINDMMLQEDTDNIDFTYNCLDWLTDGKRDRVLFVEEGAVNSTFDIPLKDMPPQLPPLDSLVPVVNQTLDDLQKENAFNKVLLGLAPAETWLAGLALTFTLLVGIFGFIRLANARHRLDWGVPVLSTALAKRAPSGTLLEERRRALLRGGNLWEAARALARPALEAALGREPPAGVMPRVAAACGWWRAWGLRTRVRRLWQVAYGKTPVRIRPREFARLMRQLDEVTAAIGDGTLRLEFSNGSTGPQHGSPARK